jgi:hypothetical protein
LGFGRVLRVLMVLEGIEDDDNDDEEGIGRCGSKSQHRLHVRPKVACMVLSKWESSNTGGMSVIGGRRGGTTGKERTTRNAFVER